MEQTTYMLLPPQWFANIINTSIFNSPTGQDAPAIELKGQLRGPARHVSATLAAPKTLSLAVTADLAASRP